MAAIDFPANPVNGQQFVAPNSITYTYVSPPGYWKAAGTGAPFLIIAAVAPTTNISSGQLWWNSELGQLFVYYDDGSSVQWVPAAPAVAAVP